MLNRVKNVELTWGEFAWKVMLTGIFCVPVPILGLGLLGWYLSMVFGLTGLSASLLVAFMSLVGTGMGVYLSVLILLIGHKEQ